MSHLQDADASCINGSGEKLENASKTVLTHFMGIL